MFNVLSNFIDSNTRELKKTEGHIKKINEFREIYKDKSYDDFKARVNEMRAELAILIDKIPNEQKRSIKKIDRSKGLPSNEIAVQKKLMELMPEVFAMIDTVYFRKSGIRYHDVQLKSAIILAEGQRLVEQKTGEGKTMTFQLPLALYALTGRGAHLATVNDYLTKIGGEYAGHYLSELGITIGIITPNASYKFVSDEEIKSLKSDEDLKKIETRILKIDSMEGLNLIECEKRQAYECDITMGTNNEFGFDYLRDNMNREVFNMVQRELYFCIVDEADSILIDEARTPLIISATPSDSDTEKYTKFANAVKNLNETEDYVVDYKSHSATLTEDGIKKIENILEVANIWDDNAMAYHLENALKAKALYQKDKEYLVRSGEVFIVDEFTGRVLKGRRYSEGLHQAIEAKEGVEIKQENQTFATITFQNFFRMYKVLCGGSGTILTEAEEFFKIYGLESVQIPTNKPVIRKDHADVIFRNKAAKFNAVVKHIKELNQKGQPVLVGTVSVENSELISSLLDKEGIAHQVLNAKYHEQESKIIAQAGTKGAVTVATNMAGRGTDIVIGGGRRDDSNWQEIADLGGLYVIGTERHDARRIDNQLRGRTGRQGEPGESKFYVSMDDEIMRVLGGEIMDRLLNFIKVEDDMPIEMKMISNNIEMAQKRIEGLHFDNRKRVVEYDDVMNQHREIFYTRRRDLLDVFERALGRFVIDGKFYDLNTSNDNDGLNLQDKKEQAIKEVEDIVKLKVIEEIDHILNINLKNATKLNDALSKEIVEDYLKVIPADYLVKIIKVKGVKEKLLEDIKDLEDSKARDYFIKLTQEVIEQKIKDFGADFVQIVKIVTLQVMDQKWVDHLEIMNDLRQGIGLQGYAQKDPLVEYKNQSFGIFETFIFSIDSEVVRRLVRLELLGNVKAPTPTLKTNEDEVSDVLTGSRETEVKGSNKLLSQIENQSNRSLLTNAANVNKTVSNSNKIKFNRNDKVNVVYSDGRRLNAVKFKKVEDDVLSGKARVV